MTPLLRLVFVVFLFIAVAASPAAKAQQIKVGSVDMAKIFDEYYKTKVEKAKLDEIGKSYDRVIRDRGSELEKKRDDLKKLKEESENLALSEDKRTEKRKAFDDKLKDYNLEFQDYATLREKSSREFEQQFQQKKKTLVEDIVKIIQDKAKRDGYTMIVDKSGLTSNLVPPFIFIQDSLDITLEVIKTLNAGAPATPPSSSGSDKAKDAGDKPKEKEKK